MTDFKNEFSWSFSRYKTFSTCKRQYYYNHYGFWGGWEESADEETKKLYMLKNMTSIPMLVGMVVHKEVDRILESIRRGWSISQDKAETEVLTSFKRAWRESKNKEWQENPKWKTNLFEHYYNKELPEEKLIEMKDVMVNSIKGFYASDSLAFIKTLSTGEWLSKEDLDSFEINGTKIWVKLDFAARHGDRIYVYDWKTGKEVKEDENQLAIYTLYAMDKWAIELKFIRLFDVYLRKQIPIKVKPTKVLLQNALNLISNSIKEMKSLNIDVEENVASIENFPMVESNIESWPCSYCKFKEMCYPGKVTF